MDEPRRAFLDELLSTPSPAGFEREGQRVWVEYVSEFADDVRTDAYGNAVAAYNEGGDGPTVAFAGHADEIGLMVKHIDDRGYLRPTSIGGADATVSRGRRVEVHTADGSVAGVVGQEPIHLRDGEDDVADISEQHVDIGAADGDEARELVDVGDPITFATPITELQGSRLAARGMDNRIGTWAAAEGLRRVVETDADTTLYAVSTVQEEISKQGASAVGFNLDPDAVLVVDVTFSTDTPDSKPNEQGDVKLGDGPAIGRGSANHPVLVEAIREVADETGIGVQLEALGSRTGTDADTFFRQRGGIPSLTVSLPNRYMHTPVEVVDTDDLDALADLLAAFGDRAGEYEPFSLGV